ncbi:hypothetical protein J008_00015 [Cryptococcus neoformans]|nr:hypothetical protein J008_00015 [Cryptococcus neoformans var. grubii]
MKSFKAGGGSSSRRAEAFDTRTSTAPQEFRRGLERLSAPEEMLDMKTSIMAFHLSNDRAKCSRAPSSVDSDSSGQLDSSFDTSFDSNKGALILDDPPDDPPLIVNKSDPVDIDLEDIDPESGELTLAAFRDRLLGVRVKLVTREQMDVCWPGMREQLRLLSGWIEESGIAVFVIHIGSRESDRHYYLVEICYVYVIQSYALEDS